MKEVRAHAQAYQDRSSREAQNSEMLIQCLKASITRMVYNKIYLQREKYIILRKNHQVISDVMLTIVGLICRTPENGIERRTPSKSKYQSRYRYLYDRGSIHTENNEKTKSCQQVLERKIITFLGLIKVVNST